MNSCLLEHSHSKHFEHNFQTIIAHSRICVTLNSSFSLSKRHKKLSWKPSSGRSQENEIYKRLRYKQFVQISGLCGPHFLSYLPKHFTHLCRALYGDAILVDSFCPPIWLPEINKNIWSSLFL